MMNNSKKLMTATIAGYNIALCLMYLVFILYLSLEEKK